MEGRRWPNLFIVGAAKAGTTALWRYLGEHPDVFMSPMKEPRFFARNPLPRPFIDDERIYLGLFAGADRERYRGEASPTYLKAEHAPEAIRRVSPEASIIISLRDPVEVAHAQHLAWVGTGLETRSLSEAVRAELDGKAPEYPRYLWDFAAAVSRYFDSFGDRVFVLFLEDLVADPRGVVRELLRSLQLDPSFADRFDPTPHNQFREPRGRALRPVLTSARARRLARRLVPYRLRDPIHDRLTRAVPKPEQEPEAVRLLERFYAGQALNLAEMLGRPLPEAWERRFGPAARDPSR